MGIILPLALFIILFIILTGSHRSPSIDGPRNLKEANKNLRNDLAMFVEQATTRGPDGKSYRDNDCANIVLKMTAWEHPDCQEVKNWLVSQGFWKIDYEGYTAYSNGYAIWTAAPQALSTVAHRRSPSYYLHTPGKVTRGEAWLCHTTEDAIQQMKKEMEFAYLRK